MRHCEFKRLCAFLFRLCQRPLHTFLIESFTFRPLAANNSVVIKDLPAPDRASHIPRAFGAGGCADRQSCTGLGSCPVSQADAVGSVDGRNQFL